MKHLFIFKDSLKKKLQTKLKKKIKEKCAALSYEIYFSSSGEDAERKAAQACQNGEEICVYAGGGDGMIHRIAQAIYRYKNAALSVVPVGTGNDFVRNFGGKNEFLKLEHITDGVEKKIDLIRAGEYISANMLNIGFDASVVTRLEKLRKLPLMGHSIAYTIGLVIQLLQFPKEKLHIDIEGEKLQERFLLTFIANGQYCGGGYRSASKAKLDDGLLDVLQVKPLSRLRFLSLVGSYKNGTLLDQPKYRHLYRFWQTPSLTVEKDEPFDVCLDGEIIRMRKMEIEVLKQALRIRVPKGEF